MIQKLDLPANYSRIDVNLGDGEAVLIVLQVPPEKRGMVVDAIRLAIEPLRVVPAPRPCQGCGKD